MPFGVNSTRSQVLYRAAQVMHKYVSNIWKRGKVASDICRPSSTDVLILRVHLVHSPAQELHSLSLICIHRHKLPTFTVAMWFQVVKRRVDD